MSNQEIHIMQRVTRLERRGSEFNTNDLPIGENLVHWTKFCSSMDSIDREYDEVKGIIEGNKNQRMDIRPYMIQQPFVCQTTDKIQKVLYMYRFFQIRQLCVVNPVDGTLQGVIGREDIFAYMSL